MGIIEWWGVPELVAWHAESIARLICLCVYVDFYHSGRLGLAHQWPASIESSQTIAPNRTERIY